MCFTCTGDGVEEVDQRRPSGIEQTSSKFQARNSGFELIYCLLLIICVFKRYTSA